MSSVRVLMVDLPRVMRGILRDLLTREEGIEVVAEACADVNLSELVQATRVDAVLMRLDNPVLPEAGERLLNAHPGVLLLGMVGDGRDAVLYELRPSRRVLVEVSPNALVDALRSVHDRGWHGSVA